MLQSTNTSIFAKLILVYAGQDDLLTMLMLSQRVVSLYPSLIIRLLDSDRSVVL